MNSVKKRNYYKGCLKASSHNYAVVIHTMLLQYYSFGMAPQHTNAMHPLYQALHSLHGLSALPYFNQIGSQVNKGWVVKSTGRIFWSISLIPKKTHNVHPGLGHYLGTAGESLHHHHEVAPQQDPQIRPLYSLFRVEYGVGYNSSRWPRARSGTCTERAVLPQGSARGLWKPSPLWDYRRPPRLHHSPLWGAGADSWEMD